MQVHFPLWFKRILTRESNAENVPPTRKPYTKPSATRLTHEQAKLKLLGHAVQGEAGAKELLDLLFQKEAEDSEEVRTGG